MNEEALILHAGVAPATRIAGFESRFHFWKGASGRRYLFTESSADALLHYRGVVVLLAEADGCGGLAGRAVSVIEAEDGQRLVRLLTQNPDCLAFVHFTADTRAGRRAVAGDLSSGRMRRAA